MILTESRWRDHEGCLRWELHTDGESAHCVQHEEWFLLPTPEEVYDV